MTHLDYTIDGSVAVITLANGSQNRLSPQMLDELDMAISAIGDSDARALLLQANGPNFSFGGDISSWPALSPHELRTLLERFMQSFNRFERLSIPTVAAVQGLCLGGGLELAVRADMIFAAETARFGHPEQTLAIVTLLGGVYRVAERAGRSKAMEWALTSEQVPAPIMESFGVVNRVIPDNALQQEAMATVEKLSTGPTRAHAAHKALLRIWATGGVSAADESLADIALPLFDSDDVRLALPASVKAFESGKPRPVFPFNGR